MKSFLLNNLLPSLLLALATTAVAFAQPGSGGPQPGTPLNPTEIPVDGGISLLLAGGVAYGVKHLRNRRRKA
ncbi:PID-CTERM protein-sorting domain-containing protein [Hymenobacter sp. B1770]|uniref:PID-CTERM protein-sorting domain-containing protein n=1 Tax=Hymenobacter sp. B1770 TaxID=1718788 RepID=UPI003CFA56F2